MAEEYLTTQELAKRIKMSAGTLRNLIWSGDLRKGVHYLKPTSRKILFKWSAVEEWMHQGCDKGAPDQKASLINI